MSDPIAGRAARLTEFRETAAAVRHAWAADTEAREKLILASLDAERTSGALEAAQRRFREAEEALACADRPDTPEPGPVVTQRADGRLLIDDTASSQAGGYAFPNGHAPEAGDESPNAGA